ncbi:two-component system, NtrC family, nitrogen regulation sensor histidine kinase GlnL [Luteibacter sp. UNCMF331Sha3.1]|uniref:two-component system sensor histidine kinase NtrB n=1 Tax=Luteibacter sp. UNCMF331Sha3.1 TaxID=1502760 RepID=UPI0008CF5619|nr:ATP-binding protein [Luteibacter sp. UNCMF331Sha3.1]SEM59783.1 two-component system, NtrC family, nitrogen regulation sensor histidine kinase GlnL [Luteibacter sp. UNCMF331Sha3.1]
MHAPDPTELLTLLSTGVAIVGADGRVVWLNPALGEVLDVGPRTAVGQALGTLMRAPALAAQLNRVVAERRGFHLRGQALGVRGREVAADVSLQPLDDGRVLVEVHPLAHELASGATPLSATLRGFAHEVKNPLAGLRGAAQLLERRVGDDDLRQLAAMVIAEADRLAALADGLLRHRGAASVGPVNIHEVLDRLDTLLAAEPGAPRIRHDFDPSLPDTVGDSDRLLQILLNLARNASQAGASTVTLRTRVEHGARMGERTVRAALRIDVMDDGRGVLDDLRDTLFQPLVSGRPDGTGLGLALSREIAVDHGGDLRYVSHPGETIFSLYLPMERAHE